MSLPDNSDFSGSSAGAVSAAVRASEEDGWYGAVRKNAPLWVGYGLSPEKYGRFLPFVSFPGETESLARFAAIRKLDRLSNLREGPSPMARAARLINGERGLKILKLSRKGRVAEAERELVRLGRDAGLLGAAPRERGRPARLTRSELLEAQKQAVWLAGEVRAFEKQADEFARALGLSAEDVWAIRFPMLESELVEKIRRARLPRGGNLNGVADRMVIERTGITKKYLQEIRHGTEPRRRRRKKESPEGAGR